MTHVVVRGFPARGSAASRKCAQTMPFVLGTRPSGGPPTVELAHASETTPSSGAASRTGSFCGESTVGLPTAVTSSV